LDWYAELLAMLVDAVAVKSPPTVLVGCADDFAIRTRGSHIRNLIL